MSIRSTILFLVLALVSACTVSTPPAAKNDAPGSAGGEASQGSRTPRPEATPRVKPAETAKKATDEECRAVRVAGKKILASQTFALDFEPFRGSCFVTTHDPEFTDPPIDSEYSIYKDGEKEYQFPEQFNGVTSGCWVEGVAFQDLNGDGLTDVIVAGMCSAKAAPYASNMVFRKHG